MIPQNNFDKYTSFREQYQAFSFEKFDFYTNKQSLTVKFKFLVDEIFEFEPVSTFHFADFEFYLSENELKTLLFHIGLVESISYWKAVCPKKMIIKPFFLNREQIQWWKKLWFYGLGEFFWLNGIKTDEQTFMQVECHSDVPFQPLHVNFNRDGVIVPVGGGKDSCVTLEFYDNIGADIYPMLVNARRAMLDAVQNCGISNEKVFFVHRTIDSRLLHLNEQGYLNGHTPFSSLLAFQSLLCSAVSGIANVALSNESSANESTIPGTKINHQYSKSLEFENDFREYVLKNINAQHNYFSVLRPLSELQITYAFSRFNRHFVTFRSCNVGSKENKWCGKCPKCLFTALMLLPFAGVEKLNGLFGYDILNNEELLFVFRQLTGLETAKPFECVGTPEEIILALNYFLSKSKNHKPLPLLLQYHKEKGNFFHVSEKHFFEVIMQHFSSEHNLPSSLYEQLVNFVRTL